MTSVVGEIGYYNHRCVNRVIHWILSETLTAAFVMSYSLIFGGVPSPRKMGRIILSLTLGSLDWSIMDGFTWFYHYSYLFENV